MADQDTLQMLADYMENGFLENIIDMFRQDPSLYAHLPSVMTDERSRVRIGYVNLIETLMDSQRGPICDVIPELIEHLKDDRPQIRADIAYLLEVIRDGRAVAPLEAALKRETVEPVREVFKDALDVLRAQV